MIKMAKDSKNKSGRAIYKLHKVEIQKQKAKKITDMASSLTEYWSTYNVQPNADSFTETTFLDDALYGIGIAMNRRYEGAEGYDEFKKVLIEHLKRS